jgi:hypothetical protein
MTISERHQPISARAVCSIVLLSIAAALSAQTTAETHDNAAMLYYQAFLLCPDDDSIPNDLRLAILRRGPFDDQLNEKDQIAQMQRYVTDYGSAIELAVLGSRSPFCEWAIPHRPGDAIRSKLSASLRSLAFLCGAEVQIVALNREYEVALARCMTLRQVAEHLAEDAGIYYLEPVTVEGRALIFTHRVLDIMPPNAKSLLWLKQELGPTPGFVVGLADWIRRDFEQNLEAARRRGTTLTWLRKQWAGNTPDVRTQNEILNYADDHLLDLIREAYSTFLDNVVLTLTSDMEYDRVCGCLKDHVNALEEEGKRNPLVLFAWMGTPEAVPTLYSIKTAHTAYRNAVRAAIEVYLVKADTGQLPASLPEGLVKDPFAGRDFEYERTERGFVLRSRAKPVGLTEIPTYEFVVTEVEDSAQAP